MLTELNTELDEAAFKIYQIFVEVLIMLSFFFISQISDKFRDVAKQREPITWQFQFRIHN
jgi:hypothetical protein